MGFRDFNADDYDQVSRSTPSLDVNIDSNHAVGTQREPGNFFFYYQIYSLFIHFVRKQNIPSQIWFFEKADGITDDKFLAKRHFDPGRYTIRSCHNAQFMKTKYNVTPPTLELKEMDIKPTLYTVMFTVLGFILNFAGVLIIIVSSS